MSKRILIVVGILVVFGLVMLWSASVFEATKKFNSPSYYVVHQLLWGVLPGIVLMLLLWRVDYHAWRKFSFLILIGSLALMILVFVPQFGIRLKGATSWVNILGYSFQPSEFLKLGLIIYLAAWFGGRHERARNWQYGILPFLVVLGFISLLLILQPDVGTLAIVIAIAVSLFFLAGSGWKQFGILVLIGAILFGSLVAVAPYRLARFTAVLDPSTNVRGTSYQLNQALIAIGSGGLWGVGYGKSTQKLGFLPETVGDSIFAVIGEELGFAGAVATVALYLILCVLLMRTAARAPDKFSQLYMCGMTLWIMIQAFVNTGANVGLIPLTGITLPFISYGGTSMLALLAGMGITLNIADRV